MCLIEQDEKIAPRCAVDNTLCQVIIIGTLLEFVDFPRVSEAHFFSRVSYHDKVYVCYYNVKQYKSKLFDETKLWGIIISIIFLSNFMFLLPRRREFLSLFTQTPLQYQRPFSMFVMIFKLAHCIKNLIAFAIQNLQM